MMQANWYERLSELRGQMRDDPHGAGIEGLKLFEDWLYESANNLSFPKKFGGMREYIDFIRKRGALSRADSARAIRFADVRNCISHRSGLLIGPGLAEDLLDYLEQLFRSEALDAQQLMTTRPHTVKEGERLRDVTLWMLEHDVSHVPVVREDRVIGLLTNRDIVAVQARATDPEHRAKMTVGDAMRADSYEEVRFLPPRAPYDEVLAHLREPGIHCVLVTEGGREDEPLLGIITATDILPRL